MKFPLSVLKVVTHHSNSPTNIDSLYSMRQCYTIVIIHGYNDDILCIHYYIKSVNNCKCKYEAKQHILIIRILF